MNVAKLSGLVALSLLLFAGKGWTVGVSQVVEVTKAPHCELFEDPTEVEKRFSMLLERKSIRSKMPLADFVLEVKKPFVFSSPLLSVNQEGQLKVCVAVVHRKDLDWVELQTDQARAKFVGLRCQQASTRRELLLSLEEHRAQKDSNQSPLSWVVMPQNGKYMGCVANSPPSF